VLRQQVVEQGVDVAAEELRGQLGDHRAADLALVDERPVEEPAPLGAVPDDPFLLHLGEHRGDGRQRQAALGLQRLVHVGDARLSPAPQHPHDGELQVSEVVGRVHNGSPVFNYPDSTTGVVAPSTPLYARCGGRFRERKE
jgi:hypothetical protein